MKRRGVLVLLLIVIFIIEACNYPLTSGTTDSTMQTAIAVNMALTQLSSSLTAGVPGVTPATATLTPEPFTFTPTASLTPTITLTSTPSGVWLTVLENTNCRSGPGTTYDMVTTINAGVKAEAIARNPNNDYYYVHNPNASSGFCWLWNRYSTLTGDITILPVFTPQPTPTVATPTPTADFTVSFVSLENCGGSYFLLMKITNTGSITWQSVEFEIHDKTFDDHLYDSSNQFWGGHGCTTEMSNEDLATGEWSLVNPWDSALFGWYPGGDDIKVKVTVYSKDNLTGTSLSKSINITP